MKIDHNKIVYQPFRKNFWVEVPELKAMTSADVEAYRAVRDRQSRRTGGGWAWGPLSRLQGPAGFLWLTDEISNSLALM